MTAAVSLTKLSGFVTEHLQDIAEQANFGIKALSASANGLSTPREHQGRREAVGVTSHPPSHHPAPVDPISHTSHSAKPSFP